MKRKGTLPDKEQDKKKSAISAAAAQTHDNANESATRFKFTELADELLVHVFSHLDFKERQVTRRVCCRLLEFVDKSTPGAKELRVFFGWRWSKTTSPLASVKMFPQGLTSPDTVSLRIDFLIPSTRHVYSLQGNILATLLRSSLPQLHSIRPEKLCLDLGGWRVEGLFAALLQIMAERQVAKSVAGIYLNSRDQVAPLGPELQVRQACSFFDSSSHSGVQSLTLKDKHCDAALLFSVPQYFPGLVSLTCETSMFNRENSQSRSRIRELGRLSSHPTLRELRILDLIKVQITSTLAAFSNIQKLDIVYYTLNSRNREEHFNAFGDMLSGMTSLESLHTLFNPSVEFWEYVIENNVVSYSLRELKIRLGDLNVERVEAMVNGVQRLAPCLTTLCLDYRHIVRDDYDVLDPLTHLRQHPTLEKLVMTKSGQDLFPRLQQGLGNKVQLVLVSPY